jgi:hypothetical protein
MAQENPSLRSQAESFTSRSRSKEIVEGGMRQGIYRLRVTQKQSLLSISVANTYDRNIGRDRSPYYSAFRIDMNLDPQGEVTGLKRSLKQEAKVGMTLLKKSGLKQTALDVSQDINTNYPKGRFWATVSLGNGNEMHLGFIADKNNIASLATVVLDGRVLGDAEARETLGKIRTTGLELPELIDVVASTRRFLTEKLTPKEMRDRPFVGHKILWSEPEHNAKNK